jgi:hypothetical protein
MHWYKEFDVLTTEDDEQIFCLASCDYKDNTEYILACDYEDNAPSKSIYILKVTAEDGSIERMLNIMLELKLMRIFRRMIVQMIEEDY